LNKKAIEIVTYNAQDSDDNIALPVTREYVIGYTSQVVEKGHLKMIADDFTMSLENKHLLTEEKVITYAVASSWKNNSTDFVQVYVNKEQLATIQQAIEPGAYQLTFTAVDQNVEIEKNITITL